MPQSLRPTHFSQDLYRVVSKTFFFVFKEEKATYLHLTGHVVERTVTIFHMDTITLKRAGNLARRWTPHF
jgi:hypothetical protein